MRRPLGAIAIVLLLLVGVWVLNVLAYGGSEEETPAWFLAIWFALWGLLAILAIWAITRMVRARGRAGSPDPTR